MIDLNEQIMKLFKRTLRGQVSDVRIPEGKIGEGKEYHWRSSSINHEPILIYGESGKIVAGAGKTEEAWAKHQSQKADKTQQINNQPLSKRCSNLQEAA